MKARYERVRMAISQEKFGFSCGLRPLLGLCPRERGEDYCCCSRTPASRQSFLRVKLGLPGVSVMRQVHRNRGYRLLRESYTRRGLFIPFDSSAPLLNE